MELSFGDIVLLKFPFTNTQSFKKRPALILKDTNDSDIIVCRITSKIYTSVYDIELTRWEECNLRLPSTVRVHKIASLDIDLVESKIGEVDQDVKERVKKNILTLFEE